jgi:hypothetical protein
MRVAAVVLPSGEPCGDMDRVEYRVSFFSPLFKINDPILNLERKKKTSNG